MKKLLSWIFICLIVPVNISFAHSGRTDSKGGHHNRRTGDYHYHNGGSSPSSLSLVRTQPRTTFPSTARTLPRSITAPLKKVEIVQPDPEKLAKEKLDKALSLLRETVRDHGPTKAGEKAKKILEIDNQVSQEQQALEHDMEEKKAQEALDVVKWLMNKKMNSSAEKRINDLINDHPNTNAANEAKAMLEEIKR